MSVKQEWREGWGAVVSAALGVGMAAVVAYGLGAFMAPLTAEFGWTRAQIALAISITSIVAGVGAPFVGMVVDRLGARLVALAGTLFTCAAYATLSRLDGSLSSYWMHWGIIALGPRSAYSHGDILDETVFSPAREAAYAAATCAEFEPM